jgi:integrase
MNTPLTHSHRHAKHFYLTAVSNKYGPVYYVRYTEHGRLVPSRWNTHTASRAKAEKFARDNREALLAAYHTRKDGKDDLYPVLETYFAPASPYLTREVRRGRTFTEHTRQTYHNFMIKTVIPFFHTEKVLCWHDVTTPLLARLQDTLLLRNKPQTVNRQLGIVEMVFSSFFLRGLLRETPFALLRPLKVHSQHLYNRGCYDLDALHGIFRRRWKDPFARLLCLTIYTTGLRNIELERLRVEHLVTHNGITFFDITNTKTVNGIRLVPVHPYLLAALQTYIRKKGKAPGDRIFLDNTRHLPSPYYREAALALASLAGLSEKEMDNRKITFYSGRAFYRTLLDAADLGDVDEYFMGHRVSRDVSKRYNHRDKQGRDRIAGKAKEVFTALEARLLAPSR